MSGLAPLAFSGLVTRAFQELERRGSVFDLPTRKFFLGDPRHDTSVVFHGHRASTPLGPAAGPHTQMAQNIVLGWLGGARIFELKTVQILDELIIPRPCIDARTVGFNIEWSQELKLEQSLEEYVKASMLIEMLTASGALPIPQSFNRTIYDMSVGYDLAGIRSDRVVAFMRGLLDARPTIERLRQQIPASWRRLAEIDFAPRVADTVTLSTFHGCPVAEIERIVEFLMCEAGVNCTVKLNPMLLGYDEVHEILHDRLGFTDIEAPASAFENDAKWEEAVAIVDRLRRRAVELGRTFGVKLTNTLIVNNRGDFLPPSEKVSYLSGPPLHVLAMHLVRRFRQTFGDSIPISFSAGIDRSNYADAVSLGLVPVTVCTDLLKQGGYGRLQSYATELSHRMDAAHAVSISDFIIRAGGEAEVALDSLCLPEDDARVCRAALRDSDRLDRAVPPEIYGRWVAQAKVANTEKYVESLDSDPRYCRNRSAHAPGKTGHPLTLFDCATCDLCIPACPNDAISRFAPDENSIPRARLVRTADRWDRVEGEQTRLARSHQIAIFVELCNDCGNCEVFCPDDGKPNEMKFRLYGDEERWRADPLDGFFLERDDARSRVLGRVDGLEYELTVEKHRTTYSGPMFNVVDPLVASELRATAITAPGDLNEIDLWPCILMDFVRRTTFDPRHPNFINSHSPEEIHAS
jgi:putative selenate reductase